MPNLFCCCRRAKKKRVDENGDIEQKQDLTTKKNNPLTNIAIEELKSKLIKKNSGTDGTIEMIPDSQRNSGLQQSNMPQLDESGLIVPRKPANPVKENNDRQNLHRELIFNQKIGKSVLNQKSELQKALEKQKENLAKKELKINVESQTPELEKVIADRAKRLQENNDPQNNDADKEELNNELLQARMKLKARTDSK